MPTTIQDHYIPELQQAYVNERSTTKSALWMSGIVSFNDTMLSKISSEDGNRFDVPFNRSIEDESDELGSYDRAVKQTPTEISTDIYTTQATARTKSWTAGRLDRLVVGNKPLTGVVNEQLGKFWENAHQRVLLNQVQGIIADNVANDSGDMLNDIYSDIASPAAANLISSDAVIDTRHTMGDARSVLGGIIMHSKVRKQLEKDEPNNFIPASATNIGFDTYLGMVIMEDDSMTVGTGTNSDSYDTILFGAGVFGYGSDSRLVDAWDRDETSGNGLGEDFLTTRRRFCLHPAGFDFSMTNAYDLASNANYADGALWDRKVADRKQIGMAVLRSNAL